MHVLGGIALPIVPAVAWALLDLFALITFVVCAGLLWSWRRTIGAFLVWLGNKKISAHVHGVGFTISPFGFALTIDQHAQAYLGQAVAATEHAMVYAFNRMVGVLVWSWHETAGAFTDVYNAIRATAHATSTTVTKVIRETVVKPITKTITIVKGTSAVITKQLTARIHALEQRVASIAHAIPHGVAALPSRVGITSKQMRRLERRLTRVEKVLAGGLGVAAVAYALGRLKLGWLRCPSLLRMGRKLGCVGFGWLEMFFATTFEALVVLDLCRFALAAQQLARLIVPNLAGVLLVQNAVCLGGGASYPSAHDSPETLTRVTLPSAHD